MTMTPLKCDRCGFDGSYASEVGHQCLKIIPMDEYDKLSADLAEAVAALQRVVDDSVHDGDFGECETCEGISHARAILAKHK